MYCPFCGKEAPENAVFCSSCGRQMPARANQQAQQPEAGGQTPQTPQVEPVLPPYVAQPIEPAQHIEPVQQIEPEQSIDSAHPNVPESQTEPTQPLQPLEHTPTARADELTQTGDVSQPFLSADNLPVGQGPDMNIQQAAPAPAPTPPIPEQQSTTGPIEAQPGAPISPAPAPQMSVTPAPASQTADTTTKKSGKVKIMIAVAAAVVVLGGGFAAAWFSGALDGVFNRNPPVVATRKDDDDDIVTTAAASEKEEVTDVTTEAGSATTTAATTASTTAPSTNATVTTVEATTQSGGGAQGAAFERKTSPAMAAFLSDMNLTAHTSSDESSKGAVEEAIVNFSSIVLGSARNISASGTSNLSNVVGLELNLALDVTDSYINEIMPLMFGPYGADPQIVETIRLACASELGVTIDMSGDVVDDMLNPVVTLNADWLVKSNPFISFIGYLDLDDILFTAPALTDKVFRVASTMVPIPAVDIELLKSQPAMLESIGVYVGDLMPYIEQMAVAAIGELDNPVEGKEELTLGGQNVVFDTLDLEITEESSARAAVAALTIIKNSPEAQDLLLNAYNEISSIYADVPSLDSQTLRTAIDNLITQMRDLSEYSYNDEVVRIRLYMYDGLLSGIAVSDPEDAVQFGYVAQNDVGYSFWINDLLYSEFEEINLFPPSQIDSGVGDRSEIHGAMSSGPNGLTGDVSVMLRELDEVFDERLMSFSDLNIKVIAGIPAPTGKFTVKMNDIYNAFIGKESHYNSFVWQTAYAMQNLDAAPILKDLEFTLEFYAAANNFKVTFGVADPGRDSKASLSLGGYITDKALTPPQGERIDVNNTDPTLLMELVNEMIDKLFAKIDDLSAAGYDMAWLKPVITSQLMGQGGGLNNTGGGAAGAGGSLIAGASIRGYVFENSSDEILDPQELVELSADMLSIARNEIYARHGWVFDNIDLQMYFNQQDWYVPLYNNDAIELNEIESVNVAIIMEVENYLANMQ